MFQTFCGNIKSNSGHEASFVLWCNFKYSRELRKYDLTNFHFMLQFQFFLEDLPWRMRCSISSRKHAQKLHFERELNMLRCVEQAERAGAPGER